MPKLITAGLGLLLALPACDTQDAGAGAPQATQTTAAAPQQTAAAAATTQASGLTDDAVVASWDGGNVTYGDLKNQIGSHLIQMEVEYLTNRYQTESQAADQLLTQKLIEAEAEKRGISPDDLVKAEVEDKTEPPTEDEIQEIYQAMQRQLRGRPLEEVRGPITQQALQRKQQQRFSEWVAQLKEATGAKVTVPFPDLPRLDVSVDDDPMIGNKDAPVTIVQFAEYQCPYCGRANDTMERILKDYDGKVRMVFRDFPLSFHDRAIPAAIAANCADKQGKYWEMHDRLMSNQRALTDSDLESYAKDAGLDLAAWNECRQDPAIAAEINADMEAGAALGVSGTPAFFVNGIMLSGALPYDMFAQIIDKELGEG
ncbi:MAG: hypothetical protein D6798_08955 [Deltaproteobacteria bacterium]|nr:MAG: hypothetical protein D6798_08955 [Deltaproteobacteria bacterium]